jgi:hypothetical protein
VAAKNPAPAQWRQGERKRSFSGKQNGLRLENTMSDQIHSYRDLQQQIHNDLRRQHPDWIEPNGDSPICDFYEARLAELLGVTQRATTIGTAKSLSQMNHAVAA